MSYVRRFIVVLGVALLWAPALRAQSDADCLGCHADASMSMERKGRTISLAVDGKAFAASAHAGIGCVSCHEGSTRPNSPMPQEIKPVNCFSCHESDASEEITRTASMARRTKRGRMRRGAWTVIRPTRSVRLHAGAAPEESLRRIDVLTMPWPGERPLRPVRPRPRPCERCEGCADLHRLPW